MRIVHNATESHVWKSPINIRNDQRSVDRLIREQNTFVLPFAHLHFRDGRLEFRNPHRFAAGSVRSLLRFDVRPQSIRLRHRDHAHVLFDRSRLTSSAGDGTSLVSISYHRSFMPVRRSLRSPPKYFRQRTMPTRCAQADAVFFAEHFTNNSLQPLMTPDARELRRAVDHAENFHERCTRLASEMRAQRGENCETR